MTTFVLKTLGVALAAISVVCCGNSDSVIVDLGDLPTGMSTSPSSLNLLVGDTITLSAIVLDAAGDTIVGISAVWTSSNPSVANVVGTPDGAGFVTAVSAGNADLNAVVTARTNQVTALIPTEVIALEASTPASISVSPQSMSLNVGESLGVTARVLDQFGDEVIGAAVTWRSADNAIATVTAAGLVLAHSAGATVVTASAEAVEQGLQVQVNDTVPPSPTPTGEPTYDPNTDRLIHDDDFDGYANESGLFAAYSAGRDPDSVFLAAPGRGGSGKAVRMGYNFRDPASDDHTFGTQSKWNAIGSFDGTLPEVAAPYGRLFFTSWFRTSVGADPTAGGWGGIKGFMFFHTGGGRYEWAVTKIICSTGGSYIQARFPNQGSANYCREQTVDIFTTSSGEPPNWSNYNDGTWHRFTIEIHGGPDTKGARVWVDGVLIQDFVGRVPLIHYSSFSWPVSYVAVFGNSWTPGSTPPHFSIYFDDWMAWTN